MNLATFHNEISLADDGWAQLAVLGDYPGTAIVGPATAGAQADRLPAIQRIDQQAVDAMVSKFNSPWGRIKRFMRGCFIYNGHPDVPGFAANDIEPKGMIAGLEARPDGLWCLPVFTDTGKAMLEKGKLYFSAVWTSALVGNENGKPVFRPEILVSAGLTPTPNLPVRLLNSAPGVASGVSPDESTTRSSPASRDNEAPISDAQPSTLNPQPAPNTMNKTRIIEILGTHATGLTPESTDQQFETTLATLVANESTHKANFATEREARITGILTEGFNLGKFPANAKDTWLGKLRADFANAAVELAQLKPTLKFTSVTEGMGSRRNFANSQDRIEVWLQLVAAKMTSDGLPYSDACAAVQREHPDILNQPK